MNINGARRTIIAIIVASHYGGDIFLQKNELILLFDASLLPGESDGYGSLVLRQEGVHPMFIR